MSATLLDAPSFIVAHREALLAAWSREPQWQELCNRVLNGDAFKNNEGLVAFAENTRDRYYALLEPKHMRQERFRRGDRGFKVISEISDINFELALLNYDARNEFEQRFGLSREDANKAIASIIGASCKSYNTTYKAQVDPDAADVTVEKPSGGIQHPDLANIRPPSTRPHR